MILKEIIDMYKKNSGIQEINIVGNKNVEIDGLNLCNRTSEKTSILSYATSDKYAGTIENATVVKALVIDPSYEEVYRGMLSDRGGALILVKKPECFFYSLHEFLYANTDFYDKYDFESVIGENCEISDSAVIEHGVIIGNNVKIGHLSVIKHGTIIDDNVTIGCNTVIGSEGFQLIGDSDLSPMCASHAGGCHLCKNVYVGDNTCICNSLFEGVTYIGENVKIDNLVHVAHNLYVEKNVVITAHVAICGSARIEEGAWIAPNVSILNRVTVGKYSKVGLGSVVTRDVKPYAVVYGNPAKEHW